MESAGARIKKVRLEKGLSLEEVHKKTKIHLDILKAIEEDSFINLSPVYIRGFLKIYCKFLGLDFRDYLADYKEPQNIVNLARPKEKPLSFLKAVSIKLVSFKAIPVAAKKIFIVILILVFLCIGLFNLGRAISAKRHRSSPKSGFSAVIPSKTKVQKGDAISKPEKAKSPIILSKEQYPAVKPQGETISGIRLGIRAKEDCWIQLKADGKIIFQNMLRKGRTENWQAKDKIEISLGNAGGIDLEVNGKFISSLGRKGQALKGILITKEGMTIGR